MHIILVFTYGISLKDWDEAGVLSRELKIYKKISEDNGVRFSFITFGSNEDDKYIDLFKNLNVIPIYKYIKKSRFKYLNILKSIFAANKLNLIIGDSHLIKTNQLNGSWLAIALKFKTKLPLYIRTGYNLFEFSVKNKKSVSVKLFHYIVTQIGLLYCDLYSVTSESDKQYLKKKFYKANNIKVIPNWIAKTTETSFEQRYQKRILSVGRLEYQKNFKGLIKNLSNSKIHLDIVGDGSQKDELKDLASSCNTNLNLIGRLTHEELNKLYSKYRVFILPSFFEGNPKVVLEAMANGVLILAKNNKNISEIIKHNQNGILFDDSDDLLEITNYYLENYEEWRNLTSNAYKTIKRNNLLENVIDTEYKIYNTLVND